jgi:pimeloyl-ACP methyl ester carboxylesterase
VDYTKLFDDIRSSIDTVHRDGSLKAEVKKDLGHYVVKDPELGPALHKLRSGGKKLFLLTNSLWDYTDAVMRFVLDGVLPEYPSWRNYFDVVVTGAAKPTFFTERRPLWVLGPDGTRLGEATVLERASPEPGVSVVCMHGYLENFDYFTQFYADPDIQLILISSAGYHAPEPTTTAAWARAVTGVPGTIEYDAAVLVQALEHLPRAARVRVHGHSRGGAVVLEASVLRPDLFADVEVVLEAPVLPGGRTRTPISAAALWVLPFIVPLWRMRPISNQNLALWGRLDDPWKRRTISALPFNPRRVRTMLENLRSIAMWSARTGAHHLSSVRGTVIVPGDDRVLDAASMLASAERAGDRLQIVHAPGSSHFVLFDAPELLDLNPQRRPAPSAADPDPSIAAPERQE